jgi:hypothetical protein
MLHNRKYLFISAVIAIIGLIWLLPITGATQNGEKSFLGSFAHVYGVNRLCDIAYHGSAPLPCDDYQKASTVGFIACIILVGVLCICVFQLVRLWVRNHLRS